MSFCQAGKYSKFFHKQDPDRYLSSLACGKPSDVMFISFFGNEMLKKTKHGKDDNNKFHVEDPQLLSGEEFNMLVADTAHMINAVKSRFAGSLYILGPFPRHLEKCCDVPSHKVKDYIGVEVDMVAYTEVFSNQLRRQLSLPADTFFIDFRQIFGSSFSADTLSDHVHLKDSECQKLANALIRGPEVFLPAPQDETAADSSFAEALNDREIITPDLTPDPEGQGQSKGFNFDDLDYEH